MGKLIPSRSQNRCSGISLLEMLVVLVLVSILLGAVSLNFFTSPSEQVKSAATHLRDQLVVLRDQAILQGKLYSIVFSSSEYEFMTLSADNKLVELENDDFLKSEKLPDGMHFSNLDVYRNKIGDKHALFADSSGILPTFQLGITNESETWWIVHDTEQGFRVVQQQ